MFVCTGSPSNHHYLLTTPLLPVHIIHPAEEGGGTGADWRRRRMCFHVWNLLQVHSRQGFVLQNSRYTFTKEWHEVYYVIMSDILSLNSLSLLHDFLNSFTFSLLPFQTSSIFYTPCIRPNLLYTLYPSQSIIHLVSVLTYYTPCIRPNLLYTLYPSVSFLIFYTPCIRPNLLYTLYPS